jgi:L,D-transpeptidase catalytic domain
MKIRMDTSKLDRRGLLKAALVGGAVAAVPARAFAQASTLSADHAKIVARARQELGRVGSQLWRRDKVGMVDFSRPSTEPRLFIVDMVQGNVTPYYVAHGRGSDPEHDGFLKTFSNEVGSYATSRGAYMALEWYQGKYGSSMRLAGLDGDNNRALDRAIVVHEAWYSDPAMIGKWGKLGRSEGCFAVAPGKNMDMNYHLGGGRLLFADKL